MACASKSLDRHPGIIAVWAALSMGSGLACGQSVAEGRALVGRASGSPEHAEHPRSHLPERLASGDPAARIGVQRGLAVIAASHQGDVVVKADAYALQTGPIGGAVLVRLAGGRTSLMAVVTAPNEVRVLSRSSP